MSGVENDSAVAPVPDYRLSDKVFLASNEDGHLEGILKEIKQNSMAPYYKHLYYNLKLRGLEWDEQLYTDLTTASDLEIKSIESEIEKLENEDESEMDLLKKWTQLGEFYTKIGNKSKAEEILLKTIDLAPSTGIKIDLYLTISRIGFFFNDLHFIKKYLDLINDLIEKGSGDWERRNKFKTYKGIYLLSIRDFTGASKLLIDSLSTFTSVELTSFENIAKYSLIAGIITLNRPDLKSKLIENSEILSVNSKTDELLPVFDLIKSFYFTEYEKFLPNLLKLNDKILSKDKYLALHSNYFIREVRCRAYSQLLESYKSLSLKSMAKSFGISVEFLDDDLCRFISSNKLNCVIDKVNGIVETNRADSKNVQYQLMIKNGDALLTKLQKYGAAVRLTGAEKV